MSDGPPIMPNYLRNQLPKTDIIERHIPMGDWKSQVTGPISMKETLLKYTRETLKERDIPEGALVNATHQPNYEQGLIILKIEVRI